MEEVRENLKDALELILKSNIELIEKNIKGKNIIKEKITLNKNYKKKN